MTRLKRSDIPKDFEVQPLTPEEAKQAKDPATCGTCGLTWDDGKSTTWTPTPSGRCPFEYFHKDEPKERRRKRLTGVPSFGTSPESRKFALEDAHQTIEATKLLANTTGIRWVVFFQPLQGWNRTDTPAPRWLPISSTIAVVYPHPKLHDKQRERAWERSNPVEPYLPHCTEIITEHTWVMDLENGGRKPSPWETGNMMDHLACVTQQEYPLLPWQHFTGPDTRAKARGLRYRLTPSENQLAPLYVKGLMDIGPAMREFPKIKFIVADLGPNDDAIGFHN